MADRARADRGLQPGWARRHTPSGRTARRQIAFVGLVGVALELVIVQTALTGLQRVDVAYQDVARINQAERFFSDADQAHDALHADVLQALLVSGDASLPVAQQDRGLAVDAANFRRNLRKVDTLGLSPSLSASLKRVRPLQQSYVDAAERLGGVASSQPGLVRSELRTFSRTFVQLERAQGDVTRQLNSQAKIIARRADRDERAVRLRILVASLVVLVGLLFLTWLLDRLGRALARMVARERGAAETLQHSLLPDALPAVPGLELAARYVPGGGAGTQVGGDWYDVFPLPRGRVGLVMGDVAGHDLRAASVMGQLRHALRAYAVEGLPPAEVLQRLNRLSMSQLSDEMATCLYAVLDPVAARLEVSNAGHYAPLLLGADGRSSSLDQPASPPLGAVRDATYPAVVHQLELGSTLVLFTDGLVERRGVPVAEGLSRLEELLRTTGNDLDELCDDVLGGLLGDQPPSDDVAVLAVRPAARLGRHLDIEWPADPSCLVDLRRTLERWLNEAGADEFEQYEIVVACSEAATNAIEHAYGPGVATFRTICDFDRSEQEVAMVVRDQGQWRSARGRDRGRGLLLVEGVMDSVAVHRSDQGTEVTMRRRLSCRAADVADVQDRKQVSA